MTDSSTPLHLTPVLSDESAALLAETTLLHTLVDGLGSLLNILLPHRVRHPDRVMATGPETPEMLWLAAQARVPTADIPVGIAS